MRTRGDSKLSCVATKPIEVADVDAAENVEIDAGTLTGTGIFRCVRCGYRVSLEAWSPVPECPHCGAREFRRTDLGGEELLGEDEEGAPGRFITQEPEWLEDVRDALEAPGIYLAYEDSEHIRVIALQDGWTRIGRSLSAQVRLDDQTVSRRHALLHAQGVLARVLDDRSLNGIFVNGQRAEMQYVEDGDVIAVGRFSLYLIKVLKTTSPADDKTPEMPFEILALEDVD